MASNQWARAWGLKSCVGVHFDWREFHRRGISLTISEASACEMLRESRGMKLSLLKEGAPIERRLGTVGRNCAKKTQNDRAEGGRLRARGGRRLWENAKSGNMS